MQKTETLQLNTWVEDDPVSLEEMNENFSILDEEAASMRSQHGRHTQAEALHAYHLAHRALEQYHGDKLYDHTRNLLLADFSKDGQFTDVHNLSLDGGKKPIIAQGGYTGFLYSHDVRVCGETQILEFTPDGNGTLTRIEFSKIDGYDTTSYVKVMEADTELASAEIMEDAYAVLSCELYAGHTYRLIGITNRDNVWISYRSVKVIATPHTYESGYFTTRSFPVDFGGDLHLWISHQGAEPLVELKAGSGSYGQITSSDSEVANCMSGAAVTRRAYLVPDIPAGTVQLKITLSQSASRVEEFCGVVQ